MLKNKNNLRAYYKKKFYDMTMTELATNLQYFDNNVMFLPKKKEKFNNTTCTRTTSPGLIVGSVLSVHFARSTTINIKLSNNRIDLVVVVKLIYIF
jgi:hypothetical protein